MNNDILATIGVGIALFGLFWRMLYTLRAEEDPGDGSLIRAALNDIARARNMSLLAHDVGMSREGLYKALSENGNPSFTTVMRITRALGMQLRITV